MPNQHKNPMLGWRPPAELSAWVRAEAERRDVSIKVILDEALTAYRTAVLAVPGHLTAASRRSGVTPAHQQA